MTLFEQISCYQPINEQEETDRKELLRYLSSGENILTRKNLAAHLTTSAWVVSPDRSKVLMVYHNIYHSWSWMGGHADGESDLLSVALREAKEESGISHVFPVFEHFISLEILPVYAHYKRGQYVPSHLHLNVTYLFEAETSEPIRIKPDENSDVAWIDVGEIPKMVSETWMTDWIYQKLIAKAAKTTHQ